MRCLILMYHIFLRSAVNQRRYLWRQLLCICGLAIRDQFTNLFDLLLYFRLERLVTDRVLA